jgi:hypothetical protein
MRSEQEKAEQERAELKVIGVIGNKMFFMTFLFMSILFFFSV